VKLLTFLGLGKYHETRYVWRGQTFDARFAPLASVHFLQPQRLIVFLTDEARAQIFPLFQQALPPDLPVESHAIPLGKTDAELWEIFTTITDSVQEGDEIAFDITHGLRSFPYIALLVAAYLRTAMQVQVRAVVYGAFDVRDQSTTPHRAPLFDLSPMLNLLEWASAADRFNRTGDARYLASLLGQAQKRLAQHLHNDHDAIAQQVAPLGHLRSELTSLSQALAVVRPEEVAAGAARLPRRIEQAQAGLAVAASARPFQRLLNTIAQSYQPLALETTPHTSPQERLNAQRALVRWYLEHEHWVQAITLARELLVNWVMLHLGLSAWKDLDERQRVERVINAEAERLLKAKREQATTPSQPFRSLFLGKVPQVEQLLGLWKNLADKRNDIDHAGMRPNPEKAHTLIQAVQNLVEQALALTDHLEEAP